MDLINTLSGDGTGIANGRKTQVAYELKIYQHWLTVGTDKTVPGLEEIHGWIRPVFGKAREMLTLEMNDESTVKFSFADEKGNITVRGSIQSIG
jgi:hypothetical protein